MNAPNVNEPKTGEARDPVARHAQPRSDERGMTGPGDRIRVLIAEDEPAVRDAMADLVSSDPAMEVVGTAADADEAIEIARTEKPDVALVDVKMPAGGGPRATREIRRESPQTQVVAVSAYEDRRTVLEMLRAGVVGYMVKGTSAEEILFTIRRSMRGQGSLSVEITADVIRELASLLERSETLTGELQELNRTKSEMIQILSHELFTPITTIQGFALTLSEHGAALRPQEIRDLVDGVTRANGRIRRLIGNLAAAARLDREGVEVTMRPVPAADVVSHAMAEFPHSHGRLVLPTGAGALTRIWVDLDLAVRAVVVLLENALALSPEAEPVEVSIRLNDQDVDIAVEDRGPGVPEDKAATIFEAFTQTDSSTTRTHEGLGIGLYLAQRIVRAHGGRIDVAPRRGGGSTFVLTFPAFVEPEGS
jgi:signal transduction histidine kinase